MNWVLILWLCTNMGCTVTYIPIEDRNLCMRAAEELQKVKMNVACVRTQHEGT